MAGGGARKRRHERRVTAKVTMPTQQQGLIRAMWISMRARRDQYRSSYNALPEGHEQKEVFKQLTLEMAHWVEMHEKAFPDETKE